MEPVNSVGESLEHIVKGRDRLSDGIIIGQFSFLCEHHISLSNLSPTFLLFGKEKYYFTERKITKGELQCTNNLVRAKTTRPKQQGVNKGNTKVYQTKPYQTILI